MASLEDLPDNVKQELASLARDLSENPETRKDFLKLTRKVRKDVPMPEIETDEKIESALTAERAEREKLEAKMRERDAKDELQKRRESLIKSGKARGEEDVAAIEKIMLEQGITKHEVAADYWAWMNQAQAGNSRTSYQPQVLDKSTRDSLKSFFANPQAAARESAFKALEDIRKGRVTFN